MPLSWNEIRDRALAFSREWAEEKSEDAEAKSFWDGFFNVFGVTRRRVASFEAPDEELPEPVRKEITRLIEAHRGALLGYHNLRTRRAGSQKIMDFHLTVCRHLTVAEAHTIADHPEKRIKEEIPGADVTIHVDPCQEVNCQGKEKCPIAKARLEQDAETN